MGLNDIAGTFGETFARAEWVALFLGLTGLYWTWLAWSGLFRRETRGFGWKARELSGENARLGGWLWGIFATALLLAATLVWTLKT